MLAITIALNILLFLVGFAKGGLDFNQSRYGYNFDNDSPVIIFFSVLLSVIVLILWLVYYFRNNAFKSFYPKNNNALYKEWLIILVICVLNCFYTASYMWGLDVRKTAYLSDKELQHRLDVISMVSLFTDDATLYDDYVDENDTNVVVENAIPQDKSQPASLLQKNIDGFGSYRYGIMMRQRNVSYKNRDSVNNQRIKSWLINGRRDSVVKLLNEFIKIGLDHNLKSNISGEEWTNYVYNPPTFKKYKYIRFRQPPLPSENYAVGVSTSYNQYIETDLKHHVPYGELRYNYEKMYEAKYTPFIDYKSVILYLMAGFSFSLLIFSFRVTSGRSWLIALVSIFVGLMLVGLFAIMFSSGTSYAVMWLMITAGAAVYYFSVTTGKEGKGISDIMLNCCIWLFTSVVPLISMIIVTNSNQYYELPAEKRPYTFAHWLDDHIPEMFYVNLLFIIVYMYFLTISIKKWRGVAEA
ncbi:hypothetical protein AM493_05190 [Flavobacterium akiainvivens]|uniref:Uncharacterized protein n=2 Tax=Flavobacterium akiainvivens TaxID=1202724 RepID=A0A0M9VHE7_9FLAO|nr:hypothetical protein AM493_05190 [Flavobacterium akiainvivens]